MRDPETTTANGKRIARRHAPKANAPALANINAAAHFLDFPEPQSVEPGCASAVDCGLVGGQWWCREHAVEALERMTVDARVARPS